MMTWWRDKGIDGFRMDVISMISKYPGLPDGPENGNGYTGNTSCDGPNIHKYLREMNEKVLSKYRLISVGECPGVNAEQAKKYAKLADGVIVGSAIVKIVAEHGENAPKYVFDYVKSMKDAIR